jgi:hypothetical protein
MGRNTPQSGAASAKRANAELKRARQQRLSWAHHGPKVPASRQHRRQIEWLTHGR